MSIDQVFNTILITGVIYGFIFNAIIFLSRKRKDKPIFFLNLVVLFITLNNLQALLIDLEFSSTIVYIKHLKVPWYFLCMPLFYVFLVHYSKIDKKVRSFLFATIYAFIGMIFLRLSFIIYSQVNNFNDFETEAFIEKYGFFEEIGGFIYTFFILIFAVTMFTKNKKWFEYVLKYDDLKWIKHFLIFAGIIVILWIVAIYRSDQDGSFNDPQIYYPVRLSTTILLYWIGIKGLFRYRTMEDRIGLREKFNKEIKNIGELNLNISNDAIEEQEKGRSEKQHNLFNKVNSYVMDGKKYLDPYISLDSLANDLNISNGHLSFLINTYSKKNFSDYINGFRIDQVKNLIIDNEYVNYTIESIGLESGFNSKSTFYSAFKKFTDLSPKQFKQQFVNPN
jgi:AraC-like DNA-binding protein